MMRILIQAYKAPPVNQPGALRVYFLAQQFQQVGYEVFLHTSDNQPLFPQDETLNLAGITIRQIATRDMRTYRAQRGRPTASISVAEKQYAGRQLLHRLYHSFPFVFLGGDGGRSYIRNSVREGARLIEEEGLTHIFSSFRPWADHIVAYRLKRKYPHLIWIADFRDRPVDPVRQDSWWPALQSWWQRQLLQCADVVTTVSEGLAKHFRQDHSTVLVVRNGLPKVPMGFLTAPVSSHFKLCYTGSLYPGLQTADLLFEVLRKLINDGHLNPIHLELHYAGKDGEVWQEWARCHALGYLCVQHGLVSFQAAQELQGTSQANVLLSWSSQDYGGIMTAKLGSYLSAGRPVIGVLNGPDDLELRTAIEHTGAGKLFATEDTDAASLLEALILDLYRSWLFSGAIPWRISPEQLKPYTWPHQMAELQAVLPSSSTKSGQ